MGAFIKSQSIFEIEIFWIKINYSKLKALSAYNGQNNNGQKTQRIPVPGE